MFKVENWIVHSLSVSLVCGLFIKIYSLSPVVIVTIGIISLIILYILEVNSESNSRVEHAVALCIDESEFNVIDKIEKLRLYFKDTRDLVEYLTYVDSRILAYVFDESNNTLNYKEYINGAMKCLAFYMGFYGTFYLSIDRSDLSQKERVKALLSSLYLASKHINNGCDSLYIYSKFGKDSYTIDVINQNNMTLKSDFFSEKLLNIFSSENFVLSSSYL